MAAHFEKHVYHRHSHETYSFGVTDAGVQAFRCRGSERAGVQGTAFVFNPDDAHDGHAGREDGFTYRIIHVQPQVVASVLAEAGGAGLPLFREPVVHAPDVLQGVQRVYWRLTNSDGSLACDEALANLVLTAARLTGWVADWTPLLDSRRVAEQVRDMLDADTLAELGAADIAAALGRSRFAIHRAFRNVYDMAPGDYQRQVRLRHARRRLTRGSAIAEVAAEAGFADQSHLTRWFKRYYGITPGEFRTGLPLPLGEGRGEGGVSAASQPSPARSSRPLPEGEAICSAN